MTNITLINRFKPHVVSILVVITSIIGFSPMAIHADNGTRDQINCDLHDEVCVQRIGETDISLEVTPRPVQAMKDLIFKVTLSGEGDAPSAPPQIDLNMPKMDMGPNQVKMKSVGPKVFEGKGVIVKCASGHRIWRATVTVPDLGKADFIFDVIY